MKIELAKAISGLRSNVYKHWGDGDENVDKDNGEFKYNKVGLIEIGTPIPWLGNAVWAGNARSFAYYCEMVGEPELITDSAGTNIRGGNWLGNDYEPVEKFKYGFLPKNPESDEAAAGDMDAANAEEFVRQAAAEGEAVQ